MVIKLGRHGQFLACSNYPECTNTKEFRRNEAGEIEMVKEEPIQETCEKCGAPMVIKTGRFGKFLACSNYPKCKNTKRIAPAGGEKAEAANATLTGENCEKCGSPLVYRRGRFGPFIACSNYPQCRYTQKMAPAAKEKDSGDGAKAEKEVKIIKKDEPKEKKTRKKKE